MQINQERHGVIDWLEEQFKSTSQKQLENELYPLIIFLNKYNPSSSSIPATGISKGDLPRIKEQALQLASESTDLLRKRKVQEAWALYYEAELLEYRLLTDEQLKDKAKKILFQDTGELDDSEKQCVQSFLGTSDNKGNWSLKDPPPNTEEIIEARSVVQNHYNGRYYHLSLALTQLSILAAVALVASVLIIALTHLVPTSVSSSGSVQFSRGSLSFWFAVGFFGALGGAISGLYGLKDAFAASADMPECIFNKWQTIARPIVGFAAAIAISYFVIAGFVQAANLTVSNDVMFVMAFISGFSERLIIGSVQQHLPSAS